VATVRDKFEITSVEVINDVDFYLSLERDIQQLLAQLGRPMIEPGASLVEVIGGFGDFIRRKRLVTGCGYQRDGNRLRCEFQSCAFAPVAELVTGDGGTCPCPLMQLFTELLRQHGWGVEVLGHLIEDGYRLKCVFHLALKP
jgi:hypothetical protein